MSANWVCEGWKLRRKKQLGEFRSREFSREDGLGTMVDGVLPQQAHSLGKECCAVVVLAFDTKGHKHLRDLEEGSIERAEVEKELFSRLLDRELTAKWGEG